MYKYDRLYWNDKARFDVVDRMTPYHVSFSEHSQDVSRIRVTAVIWYSLNNEQKKEFYDLLQKLYHVFMDRVYNKKEKSRKVTEDLWSNTILPYLQDIIEDKGFLVKRNTKVSRIKRDIFIAEDDAFKGADNLRDMTNDLKAKYDNYGEELFKKAEPVGAKVELSEIEDTPDIFKGIEQELGTTDTFAEDIFGGLDI